MADSLFRDKILSAGTTTIIVLEKVIAAGLNARPFPNTAAVFLGVFYLLLVGSKMLIGLVAGQSRQFLRGRVYRLIMLSLGVLLAVFGVLLLYDGVQHFP